MEVSSFDDELGNSGTCGADEEMCVDGEFNLEKETREILRDIESEESVVLKDVECRRGFVAQKKDRSLSEHSKELSELRRRWWTEFSLATTHDMEVAKSDVYGVVLAKRR